MKSLVVLVLLISVSAKANRLEEYYKASVENIESLLFLNDGDHSYSIVAQDIAMAEKGMNFGIETKIEIKSAHHGGVTKRLCNTQFVQTSRGFEIFKTNCI